MARILVRVAEDEQGAQALAGIRAAVPGAELRMAADWGEVITAPFTWDSRERTSYKNFLRTWLEKDRRGGQDMRGDWAMLSRMRLLLTRIVTGFMKPMILVGPTVALAAAACAENDAPPPRLGLERSPGGEAMYHEGTSVDVGHAAADEVIENGDVSQIPEMLSSLPEECTLSFGAEGGGGEVFDGVTGIVPIGDSVVAVADRGYRDVRFFAMEPGGALLGRVGGSGDGPGEFRELRALAEHPDGVVAYDVATQRVTTIGWPALEVEIEDVRDLREITAGMAGAGPEMVGTLGDGGLVFRVQERGMLGPADDGAVIVDTSRVVVSHGRGGTLDTMARLEEPGKLATQVQDGRIFYGEKPFSTPVSVASRGDQLVFGTGMVPKIEARRTGQQIVRHIVWDDGSPEVSEEVIQSYRERMMPADEIRREASETMLTEEELSDRLPAYERIVVDARGRIWVDEYMLPWERMAGEGNRWLVFDDGGAVLGRLVTAAPFRVYAADGEFLYGTALSEFGVGYVCAIELPEWAT
jgi:hypothetical protein